VARTLLGAASVVWVVAGIVGIGIGLVGAADLQQRLPPLAIDLSALGGAVVAVSGGVLAVGLIHATVLAGMRRGHRTARSVATVVAAALAALFVALSAAAATSAVNVPERAVILLLAALASIVAAIAYGVVAVLLVAETRAGSAN
jgi:hypothetical protein